MLIFQHSNALLLALVMGGIVVAREAAADDRVMAAPEPFDFKGMGLPPAHEDGFSATDFRARGPSLRGPSTPRFDEGNASLLDNTTIWQRLREYRSHDRVRVLTLYESSASTLSLQAGKRGGPSLQWTSRALNHDGATRGIFDRLVSMAIGGKRENRASSAAPARPLAPDR